MAGGVLCLQCEPVPGVKSQQVHRESESAPQEDGFCYGVRFAVEEAWFRNVRLIVPSLKGLGILFFLPGTAVPGYRLLPPFLTFNLPPLFPLTQSPTI